MLDGQGGYLVPTDPGAGPGSRADWICIVCNKAQPHSFVDAVVQVSLELLFTKNLNFISLDKCCRHILFVQMNSAALYRTVAPLSLSRHANMCMKPINSTAPGFKWGKASQGVLRDHYIDTLYAT